MMVDIYFAAACTTNNFFFFLPPWYEYLDLQEIEGTCTVNINGADGVFQLTDVLPIGLAILDMLLRLAGFVAVIAIIVAGVMYITSMGNPERAAAARKRIYSAVIGLAIALVATALVTFLGDRLG